MSSTATPAPTVTCPGCGASATGRYCSSCGALVATAKCVDCGTALSPGAKYCHHCGTAVSATPGSRRAAPAAAGLAGALPWAVAGIALVALIALVAAQRFNARTATRLDAPMNALPQAGLDDRGVVAGAGGRAPDISSLTPRERADRLFDRIMLLHAQGKTDSVRFFAQMGIAAYQMLPPPELDHDARYDIGRIAEVAGLDELAAAQADTILNDYPAHLLALALRADIARRTGDEPRARDLERRFLSSLDAERRKNLPEYGRHQGDIDRAEQQVRGARGEGPG